MPTGLYLPASIRREVLHRREQFRADVLSSIVLDDSDPFLREFTLKLQAFDPRLLLVRASETIVPGLPMKPGYYHLLIDNGPDIPLSVTVIEGEGGEFCEPTSRLFEKLLSGDMREQRNLRRFDREAAAEFAANAREVQDARTERRTHLSELVKAYTETSISMTDARPWTQNTQPPARRAAAEVVQLDERRKKGAA
jgi:hypothetical protein